MPHHQYHISKVAVLGSGVMGSQIAAHCLNAGLDVLLLDIKSDKSGKPNEIVEKNLLKLKKIVPSPLALSDATEKIKTGNFEDDWSLLGNVDWICEAVIEKMDIKKQVMGRIDAVRAPHAIVTTNTSGLPIGIIGKDCSGAFRSHFLGTHFFNPPRYMKLLELIPTVDTDNTVTDYMVRFSQKILGKGVVLCKDTPNFIANRIGIFFMAIVMNRVFKGEMRIEEADYLTGTLSGFSKAAVFRTADMAGLDVVGHVAGNLYPNIPDDERRDVFKMHDLFVRMIENGMIGNKAGMGFYKKTRTGSGTEYKVLNLDTFEYESQVKPHFDSVETAVKQFDRLPEKLRYVMDQDDKAGRFLREIHEELFLYAANRIPEITESVQMIDRAMKWGFNWQYGPFEKWDMLGIEWMNGQMNKDGLSLPDSVLHMLEKKHEAFYDRLNGDVYNLSDGKATTLLPPAPSAILTEDLRLHNKEVGKWEDAALYDAGDGVGLFEFRSKANTIGNNVIRALFSAFEETRKNFDALVIGNDGTNFSVGANLYEVVRAIEGKNWKELEQAVSDFQQATLGIRYQPFPVVAAPFNMTLGGGCEFSIHADRIVAYQELYMGLVEAGVGLIPAGGGTTETLYRHMEKIPDDENADPLLWLKQVFRLIGMAKVSGSAREAFNMGYLRESDEIVMNRDLQLYRAIRVAKNLAEDGYVPPPERQILLMGRQGYGALKVSLYLMKNSGFISDYDAAIGEKLAVILTGGDLSEAQKVPESYVLKLEREAFLELLKESKTLERIKYTLKTGKPLRN